MRDVRFQYQSSIAAHDDLWLPAHLLIHVQSAANIDSQATAAAALFTLAANSSAYNALQSEKWCWQVIARELRAAVVNIGAAARCRNVTFSDE